MKGNKEIVITTIIGNGAQCDGDFSSQGSVRIDGYVNGNVTVDDTVIIGTTGSIVGDVSAKVVIVGGEIKGNIKAPDKTELTPTARVIGDINTSVIVIDEKAIFQGGCNMNQDVDAKRQKPPFRAVKSSKKSAKAAIVEALKEVEEESRQEVNREDVTGSSATEEKKEEERTENTENAQNEQE